MAGFVIALIAFALPLTLCATGFARPLLVLVVGAILGFGWIVSGAAGRANDLQQGYEVLPLWFLVGLVVLLFVIWCGGLWLGMRFRRARAG